MLPLNQIFQFLCVAALIVCVVAILPALFLWGIFTLYRFQLRRRPYHAGTFQSLAGLFHCLSENKNIRFLTAAEAARIDLHKGKMQHIPANLLYNDLRFTPEGITICIFIEQSGKNKDNENKIRSPHHAWLAIVARDTSIGIAEEAFPTLKDIPPSGGSEDAFVKKVRVAVEAHLDDADFDVEKLCRQLAMSHSQMHRKLAALTGLSATRFIRYVRLNKAKELLQNGALSITAVAFDSGFNDPAYFGRVFKREFGLTPQAWREGQIFASA